MLNQTCTWPVPLISFENLVSNGDTVGGFLVIELRLEIVGFGMGPTIGVSLDL